MPRETLRDRISAIEHIVQSLTVAADRPQDATPETHEQFLRLDCLTSGATFRNCSGFTNAVAGARRFFQSRRARILAQRAFEAHEDRFGRHRRERRIVERAFSTKHQRTLGPLKPIDRTAARVVSRRPR